MGRGRPTKLTPAIIERVCDLRREGGTYRSIAKEIGVPHLTLTRWVSGDEDFCRQYARATQTKIESEIEEIEEFTEQYLKDSVKLNTLRDREGEIEGYEWAFDRARVDAARLMVDTRKWRLANTIGGINSQKARREALGDEDVSEDVAIGVNRPRSMNFEEWQEMVEKTKKP